MLNKIQELIKELEAQKIKSEESILPNNPFMGHANASADGEVWAFDFCIQKLKLLLNTEKASSGQNGSANSGNAM